MTLRLKSTQHQLLDIALVFVGIPSFNAMENKTNQSKHEHIYSCSKKWIINIT